jgi:hypothetical protein
MKLTTTQQERIAELGLALLPVVLAAGGVCTAIGLLLFTLAWACWTAIRCAGRLLESVAMHVAPGAQGVRIGVKFQLGGLWVGAHYSTYNRRLCVNVLPCCTVWITLKDGIAPGRTPTNS